MDELHFSAVHDAASLQISSATSNLPQDVLPWLALNRLTECGSVSQRRLLDGCGGMQGLLQASSSMLANYLPAHSAADWLVFCEGSATSSLRDKAWRDMEQAVRHGLEVIHAESIAYPLLLLQVHSSPSLLYVKGNTSALHLPQLAIVGSRNASVSGLELAGEFASALGRQGLAITSGLAIGIDGAAHAGALRAGAQTLAVVATGLDEVYPRRHLRLAREILDGGGVLVSEMPPGTRPHAQNFPRRNRIISGLSLGTLVIEAGLQSGSLITARYAMEQGREVFALPGSIRSVSHRGCHALIRQGATLVETTQDIAAQLGGMIAFKQDECRLMQGGREGESSLGEDAIRVLRLLDHTPVSLDILAGRCNIPVAVLSAALLDLELSGLVCQQHGTFSRV